MKISLAAELLMSGLFNTMKENGFRPNVSEHRFTRKLRNSKHILQFLFHHGSSYVLLDVMLYTRIPMIESIFHNSVGDSCGDFPFIPVIDNDIFGVIDHFDKNELISPDPKKYYRIRDEESAGKVILALKDHIHDYIVPYFDKYSSIEAIDRILNELPRELSIHAPMYPPRACMALIAAKLNKNPEYDSLVEIYDEKMAKAVERYKCAYEKIKEYLKHYDDMSNNNVNTPD